MSVGSFLYESDIFLLWRGFNSQFGRAYHRLVRILTLRCDHLDLVLHLLEHGALHLNLLLRFSDLVRETINESICYNAHRV